jgi:hypothetical protein
MITVINLIEIDKEHFDCCSLNSEAHIQESLGEPLELPPAILEALGDDNLEANLLQLFALMTGCTYERVVRDNTYNYENDLSQFFVYSVYAPVGVSDWVWAQDCFVTVEMGAPGDPRYVYYSEPQVYRPETPLAEAGFFNWSLGWFGRYIENGKLSNFDDPSLEELNSKIDPGYSNNPTYELGELCVADPIWVEKLDSFVARPNGSRKPVAFYPVPPCYH